LAIEETCSETDTKRFTGLIRRALSGSRASLRAASRQLWRAVGSERKQPDAEAAEAAVGQALLKVEAEHVELDSTLEVFSAEVWKESEHLLALEEKFIEKFALTTERYQAGQPEE
jgi:hypothetical protein